MSFLANSTVEEISERHIARVVSLEESTANRLLKNLTLVKRELLDRLSYAPEGTFTEARLTSTLAQVSVLVEGLSTLLKGDMASAATIFGELAIGHLIEEAKRFAFEFEGVNVPINLNAAVLAQDTSEFLINQYQVSIDAYSMGLRQQITQGLTDAVISQSTMGDVMGKLGRFFSAELQWKIPMIARTELHNIYGKAKLRGMGELQDETIPDLKKTLFHPMDARTGKDSKVAARLKLVVDIDEPFRYSFTQGKKTITREFMTPPDRPNDRSILIPYRQEWGSIT